MCHWRPPPNQTPSASRSAFTNSSVSATFGSWVWSMVTCSSPRPVFHGAENRLFVVHLHLPIGRLVPFRGGNHDDLRAATASAVDEGFHQSGTAVIAATNDDERA